MHSNEIYSDKFSKGSRTYFFDVKKSENGDLYLKISESKKTQNGFDRNKLMVFEEDLSDFFESLKNAFKKIQDLKAPKTPKAYSVEEIRTTHPKAYAPWSTEEDNRLELLFCEGKKPKELAGIFGRNYGAIKARIKKLELNIKYGQ